MENSLKGLLLAAGTIITCIVIGLGFYIAREARDTANAGAGQISKLNAEFTESDKIMYDSLDVSGSEVVNVINKFKNDDIAIKVETFKNTIYYGRSLIQEDTEMGVSVSNKVKDAQDSTHVNYINPNAQFNGTVYRDKNNTIIGIGFKQS